MISRLDSELLLAHVLKVSRTYLHTHPEEVLQAKNLTSYKDLVNQRSRGKPLAYIIGYKEFWSDRFIVTQNVLIPRPETECLVEEILKLYPDNQQQLTVLELGTGSGAIALSLAKERASWDVVATDISQQAIQIAKRNAIELQVKNINFVLASWFVGINDFAKFDIVVSNPPYISLDDKHINTDVKQYEPHIALFSENDGLAAYEKIIPQAKRHLTPGGRLFLECGWQQASILQKLYTTYKYSNIKIIKDLQGINRVIFGN